MIDNFIEMNLDLYPPSVSQVKELKLKDFKIVNGKPVLNNKYFNGKYGLIIVYAPWCIHCKASTNTWNELATQYNYVFPIGAINAEDLDNGNDELSSMLSVKSYPTVYTVNKNGKLAKYKFDESKDELIYYISSKL